MFWKNFKNSQSSCMLRRLGLKARCLFVFFLYRIRNTDHFMYLWIRNVGNYLTSLFVRINRLSTRIFELGGLQTLMIMRADSKLGWKCSFNIRRKNKIHTIQICVDVKPRYFIHSTNEGSIHLTNKLRTKKKKLANIVIRVIYKI